MFKLIGNVTTIYKRALTVFTWVNFIVDGAARCIIALMEVMTQQFYQLTIPKQAGSWAEIMYGEFE